MRASCLQLAEASTGKIPVGPTTKMAVLQPPASFSTKPSGFKSFAVEWRVSRNRVAPDPKDFPENGRSQTELRTTIGPDQFEQSTIVSMTLPGVLVS